MVDTPHVSGSRVSSKRPASTVITDAHTGASRELMGREKRYAITMAIRTACFLSMIFVSGPFRWVLLAGAVFLPYVAVVLANQANTRSPVTTVPQADPVVALALTTGPRAPEVIQGDIVEGDLFEGDAVEGDAFEGDGDDRVRDRVA